MKITIEAEGKETLVYETDNAIVISSDGETGTSTNILITKANPKQLFGITEALKSSMFRIIKDAPFLIPRSFRPRHAVMPRNKRRTYAKYNTN